MGIFRGFSSLYVEVETAQGVSFFFSQNMRANFFLCVCKQSILIRRE